MKKKLTRSKNLTKDQLRLLELTERVKALEELRDNPPAELTSMVILYDKKDV